MAFMPTKTFVLQQVYDETDYIYDALSLVTDNLYEASLADHHGIVLFPA